MATHTSSQQPHHPSRVQWFRVALWCTCFISFLFIIGQSSCVVGATCKFDTDCPDDSLCKDGHCDIKFDGGTKQQCKQDKDCPNTDLCIQGQCKPISTLFEKPTSDSGPPVDAPPTENGTIDAPTRDNPTPDKGPTPDRPAPPTLGPTPLQHAVVSGGAISSNATIKHVAVIGQACPVVPASTVMRSTNYSVRVGVVAVTLW